MSKTKKSNQEVELIETGIGQDVCVECDNNCDVIFDCEECDQIACSEQCLEDHEFMKHKPKSMNDIAADRQQCHNCSNVAVISDNHVCPVNPDHIVCSKTCAGECYDKHRRETREMLSKSDEENSYEKASKLTDTSVKNELLKEENSPKNYVGKKMNANSLDHYFESRTTVHISEIVDRLQLRDKNNESFVHSIVDNFNPSAVGQLELQQLNDDEYLLIDGNHRLAALEVLGIETIPVVIHSDLDAFRAKVKAYRSNNDRQPFKISEKIRIISDLYEEAKQINPDLTQRDFEKQINESQSTIQEYLQLSKMHMHVLAAIDNGFARTAAIKLKDLSMDDQSILVQEFSNLALSAKETGRRVKIWQQLNNDQKEKLMSGHESWDSLEPYTRLKYRCKECKTIFEEKEKLVELESEAVPGSFGWGTCENCHVDEEEIRSQNKISDLLKQIIQNEELTAYQELRKISRNRSSHVCEKLFNCKICDHKHDCELGSDHKQILKVNLHIAYCDRERRYVSTKTKTNKNEDDLSFNGSQEEFEEHLEKNGNEIRSIIEEDDQKENEAFKFSSNLNYLCTECELSKDRLEINKITSVTPDVISIICSSCRPFSGKVRWKVGEYEIGKVSLVNHSEYVITDFGHSKKFNSTTIFGRSLFNDGQVSITTVSDQEVRKSYECVECQRDINDTYNAEILTDPENGKVGTVICKNCKWEFEQEQKVVNEQTFELDTTHRIINSSCEDMSELENNSIDLIITSWPYNANKAYSEKDKNADSIPWSDYISEKENHLKECFRVLKSGARLVINVANLMRPNKSDDKKRYLPLSHLVRELAVNAGFLMMGERIWYKDEAANVTTAWGSYLSPSLNHIRDTHEYILIFSKPDEDGNLISLENNTDHEPDLTKDEFLEWTKSVWRIPPAKGQDHPCVYPPELVRRIIKLYSWPGQIILDPFAGSGTTAAVAKELHRNSVSIEIEQRYIDLIETTIQTGVKQWFQQQPTPNGGSE